MKKVVFTSLFFLAVLAAVSAQVKLSFNPEQGAKYEFRMEMINMSKNSVGGQDISMEMKMGMTYLMEAVEKTQYKTQMRFTYQDVSYNIASSMMNVRYDSKNPTENPSEIEKMMGTLFDTMIGKSLIITVAPDGTVISMKMEEIAKSIASAGQMAAQLSAMFGNEKAMKNMFEQSLRIYPDHAVKVGDSWTIEGNSFEMANMSLNAKSQYVLKDLKKDEASIAVQSALEMDMGEGMDGKVTGTQEGVMQVDVKTGLPLSSELKQNMSGKLKVQGMDMQMDMTTNVKTSTKKVK